MQTNGPCGGAIQCFAEQDGNFFAGTWYGGVFLSTDNGQSWTAVNSGLTNARIFALAVDGTNVFAGTEEGVFLSADNGQNWTPVNTGLTTLYVTSLAVHESHLFAGTLNGGVFRSANNGQNWTPANTGMTSMHVYSFAAIGSNFFAGSDGGVFLTTNQGQNWKAVNAGLTNALIFSLAVNGSTLYAGTFGGGVFLTANNGQSWTETNTGLTTKYIYSVLGSKGNLFAGTDMGAFVYDINGDTWSPINTGLTNTNVTALIAFGAKLFAGTGDGVFISGNNGLTWSRFSAGLNNATIYAIAVSGSDLFAGTWGGGVSLSSDQGQTWTPVNTGLTNPYINALAMTGTSLVAGTNGNGVFFSDNNGQTWTPVNTGLTNQMVYALAVKGTDVFAGTYGGGVFRCSDGQTWTPANTGLTTPQIVALAVRGDKIFGGAFGGGVFISENDGQTWSPGNTGLTNAYVRDLAVSGSHVFAGTYGGVFSSDNDGQTWTPANTGLTSTTVHSLAVSGSHVFAGTFKGGVFLSNDDGQTWTSVSPDLFKTTIIFSLEVSARQFYAGTAGSGVWRRPLSEMITITTTDLTVTHTGDSGPGSFRQALLDANDHAGPDTIRFAIPETDPGFSTGGVWSIRPLWELPRITDGNLVINGFSQARFVGRDANPAGPEIEIDGSLTTGLGGLWAEAPNTELFGLVVNRFGLSGITIADGDGGRISGCYIGTDATGEESAGNGDGGIYFYGNTRNFRIIPYEDKVPGNVISGNTTSGIFLSQTCSHVFIAGNAIGLNRERDRALGNSLQGINIFSGCDSNEVSGNWIGGNGTEGIYFEGSRMNVVSNNLIGTDDNFAVDLGNLGNGIELSASGDNTLSGNVIWHNGVDGIRSAGETAKRNRITQNSIWRNKNKGINILFGANEGLAPPVIQSIASDEVTGNTGAGQTVEIFTDDAGQGKFHLGSVVSNAAGEFRFSLTGQDLLTHITATTIDASGNTSEFCSAVKSAVDETAEGSTPGEFSLSQNYPNPFNSETLIRFDVAEPCRVTLNVYDIRGKEVAVLADGRYIAGSNAVRFDASVLPSGIYMYRIQMGDFKAARKMAVVE